MVEKGDILTESQLDDAVHELIKHALSLGMIPIAGIMSRRVGEGKHEILGRGWNHLREGIPGIHGETGAIMNMGRLAGGYGDVVATSSLSPCPFCQCALALHLGVKEIRILDATNYRPDFTGYQKVGLKPAIANHDGIVETFGRWVNDPANARIWSRDIGEWSGAVLPVFDLQNSSRRTQQLMNLALHEAEQAQQAGEAPIGAVIVDSFGEVLGAGYSQIIARNDPSLVAAMSAWRSCGGRDHWKDKTLFLTAGPDHIAYSMFHIFKFGQLVIGSDKVFTGQIEAVRKLGVPVHVMKMHAGDAMLETWMNNSTRDLVMEFLGTNMR